MGCQTEHAQSRDEPAGFAYDGQMREPVRRLFLSIVRLVLFLTVVVWGISQWWSFSITIAGHTAISTCWTLDFTDVSPAPTQIAVMPVDSPVMVEWQITRGLMGKVAGTTIKRYPGVLVIDGPAEYVLSVAHWLTTTTAALLYLTAKSVCRRPPAADARR